MSVITRKLTTLIHLYDAFPYLRQSFLAQPQNLALMHTFHHAPQNQQNHRKIQNLPPFKQLFEDRPGASTSLPDADAQSRMEHLLFRHFLSTQHPTKVFSSRVDVQHTSSNQNFDISFTKSTGAGGQHRNKTQSCVRITHLVSGVQGEASEDRNQVKNRKSAWHRLFLNMALRIRMPLVDVALKEMHSAGCVYADSLTSSSAQVSVSEDDAKPSSESSTLDPAFPHHYTHPLSHFWKERIASKKLNVAVSSQAFPEIIADMLDTFSMFHWNMKEANEYLARNHEIQLSTNQLIGTLKKDKHVWAYVNQEREKLKLPPLR
uniref:Prokaryotic-type class I peptide chain release factors domain-containing protein n=1 Tax=Percolomonas cosmopolitus TaxID=63605 RepID=A0A7S1KTQ8_9EUKA|mmetsp:Transcript_933/g.3211  ORF Transcript_933/g.3211 Transcript_933/m.3211 type:complete len:319 (+) Transcript_933:102-1058(+)